MTFILSYFLLLIRKVFTVTFTNRSKIVVVSLHKLGDTVFTLPAIEYLYNLYRDDLIVICYPDSEKIYKLVFNTLNIKVVSRNGFLLGRFALPGARNSVKKIEPKFIYDLTGAITSISLISGIRTVGLFGLSESVFLKAYTKAIIKKKEPPLISMYLEAVKFLTGTNEPSRLQVWKVIETENGLILIHPFAGWKSKEWNLNKFISLAELLSIEYNCALIAESGYVKEDIKEYLSQKAIRLIETKDIEELISEIKKCSFFIGNDSGPLYIAAMLGKPTFTIYGPTNPIYSMPEGIGHFYINKKLKCSPQENQQYCFTNAGREGCPAFECMNLLSVDEVYRKLKAHPNLPKGKAFKTPLPFGKGLGMGLKGTVYYVSKHC